MKPLWIVLLIGMAVGAMAQTVEQSGVPARMEAVNGKVVPVYLQSLVNGKLVFQMYKNPKDLPPLDVDKVVRFEFLGKFDADAVRQLFNEGNYQAVLEKMQTLTPSLDEYWQYMTVANNYQDIFIMLMESYMRMGDAGNAGQAAEILMKSANPEVIAKGQAVGILAALNEGKIEEAEAMLDQLESDAGKLYFRACIERAKNQPDAALLLVVEIIAKHGNNLEWMPQAELLGAKLYMDMGITNTAIFTARQVKEIYARSNIAVDAEKLQNEYIAAKAAAEAEAKARADEEARERAEVKARAEARAGITGSEDASNPVALPEEELDISSETELDAESEN